MGRTRTTAMIGLLLLATPGCAALYIRDADGAGIRAAKVAGRVLQGALTLGFSEIKYAMLRRVDAMNRMMASWRGEDAAELVRVWGSPTRRLPDTRGGEVYSYRVTRSFVTPGSSHTTVRADSQNSATAFGGGGFANYWGTTTAEGRASTIHVPPSKVTLAIRCDFWVDTTGKVSRTEWWEETDGALFWHFNLGERVVR